MATDYPFLEVFWTMLVFFAWVVWIWMMVVILSDVFRRRDIGGWKKAAWCAFMIVLPFVGVLTYLIVQHDGLNRRNVEQAETMQRQTDEHIRAVAGHSGGGNGNGAVSEIEKAESLLARGTITRGEFEAIKSRALAAH
ncbi:MAG TPA: PLDc N-terminal domain-containing protein [Conexibacter sp.]